MPVEKDKIFDNGLFDEDHAGDTGRRTPRWGKDNGHQVT